MRMNRFPKFADNLGAALPWSCVLKFLNLTQKWGATQRLH